MHITVVPAPLAKTSCRGVSRRISTGWTRTVFAAECISMGLKAISGNSGGMPNDASELFGDKRLINETPHTDLDGMVDLEHAANVN